MRPHVARLSSGIYVAADGRQVEAQCSITPIAPDHPASINHYLLKSLEEFQAKVARGEGHKAPDSPQKRSKFTPDFWDRFDRNEAEDLAIARFIPAVEIEMKRLGSPATADAARPRADPGQC
jgi:hypothetical protein